ncbi:mannitol 1-phosphate dehydrogenase [Aaosphaeria arxii CBS 175.79]|uniref:Mannitol 1-phosphate dehydrogenase n=1 Tax=Aaosphaeria arxii CBS 175.79 TaxID=1450172 RepID=A0A6A5XFG1_9PLEO|nr:mannitol 1-phosphate dehydrogenase [Aaosphaeria arxii CBS 175.79]KAF2011599.1 mannitol 1-phosphate dehydrogenase [Aaosphaeria arxii CBS 175.79]
MGSDFNVAIVGGGISGLTLAIALIDAGVNTTIYEAAPKFGEIGAGVAFGPNAARAMELISPKVYDAFIACKTDNIWESKQNTWFTIRVGDARKGDKDGYAKPGLKVGDAWFDVNFTNDYSRGGVYRAHFLDALVKHVPESAAKFGKKLVDVEQATDGSGDVVLRFDDGTTAQHNAVIGCDGIKSKTREIVLGAEDPASRAVFSGKYAYRGLIPMDKAVELLGAEVAQNSNMFFGYHGHLLTFPIEKGRTFNVVAFASRETWEKPNWVVTTSKEEMVADFEGWGKTVQDIVGAMEKPDIWALFMHPPAKTYYKGRVCLLGDAAHATTPHQGAGAGMCIEDSLVLGSLLKDAKNVADVERAFSAYDEVRRPRSLKNVVTSKEAGQLYDFELEGDDLDKVEQNMKHRMEWVWNEDLPAQIEKARKIYQGARANI